MMKRIQKLLVAASTMASVGLPLAYGDSEPNIWPVTPFADTLNYQSAVGLDGNIRVLYINYTTPAAPGTGAFVDVTFQVLSPLGVPLFPAQHINIPGFAVGNGATPPAFTNPVFARPANNILVFGQKSGNTTLVFLQKDPINGPGDHLGVYDRFFIETINSTGSLGAFASFGPFSNVAIYNAHFDKRSGNLVLEWRVPTSTPAKSWANVAWTLNEFGGITTFGGPFGPFTNTTLGHVDLTVAGNEAWFWDTQSNNSAFLFPNGLVGAGQGSPYPGPGGDLFASTVLYGADRRFEVPTGNLHTLTIWTVTPTGGIGGFNSFGPN